MEYHSVQRGVAIFLGMLHAKETGIMSSSGCLWLWLMCTFTFFTFWLSLLKSDGMVKGPLFLAVL